MSSTLNCSFELGRGHDSHFWWPLIFEAMRRIDFTFDDPRLLPEHRGSYYCVDRETGNDREGIDVSFRDAWEAMVRFSDASVTIWPVHGDVYRFRASVSAPTTSRQAEVWFSVPAESLFVKSFLGASIEVMDVEQTRPRLLQWISGIQWLHDLCGPCSAELAWERWGTNYVVGAIGKAIEFVDLTQLQLLQTDMPTLRVRQLALAHGGLLHIIDPLPVPWQGGWRTVSLIEPTAGPRDDERS